MVHVDKHHTVYHGSSLFVLGGGLVTASIYVAAAVRCIIMLCKMEYVQVDQRPES
jgi:hypothetical protein